MSTEGRRGEPPRGSLDPIRQMPSSSQGRSNRGPRKVPASQEELDEYYRKAQEESERAEVARMIERERRPERNPPNRRREIPRRFEQRGPPTSFAGDVGRHILPQYAASSRPNPRPSNGGTGTHGGPKGHIAPRKAHNDPNDSDTTVTPESLERERERRKREQETREAERERRRKEMDDELRELNQRDSRLNRQNPRESIFKPRK